MKKIITLFVALISAASIMAQEPPPSDAPKKTPQERAENMTKRISKELALSPEQEAKVKEIILKREMRRDENVKNMKAEMEKAEAEFKAIFSAEQYQKFLKKKEEMQKKRKEARKAGPPKDGPPIDSEK